MGYGVAWGGVGGEQEADAIRGEKGSYSHILTKPPTLHNKPSFIKFLVKRRVSVVRFVAVVVVSGTSLGALRDVLRLVRLRWREVIDGEWAQRWASRRLRSAEIGSCPLGRAFHTSVAGFL